MQVNGINALLPSSSPSSGLTGADGLSGPKTGEADGGGFGPLVKRAVDSLDRSQQAAEQEIKRAVGGESPDLHQTIIALQTADLQFQLGLQIRNKLIGAYEEIMRMQV